jgi:hypothetical protein
MVGKFLSVAPSLQAHIRSSTLAPVAKLLQEVRHHD